MPSDFAQPYSYAKSSWQSKEIQVKLRASKEAYVSVLALRATKKVAIFSEIHVARGCSRCKKIRLMFPHEDVSFLTKAMAVGDSRKRDHLPGVLTRPCSFSSQYLELPGGRGNIFIS